MKIDPERFNELFASPEHPLRASALTSFQSCPGWTFLEWLDKVDEMDFRDSGRAADTGTALGLMVELFHKGRTPEAAVEETKKLALTGAPGGHAFPLADLPEAARAFGRYAADPRNQDVVLVNSLEREVSIELPPHQEDPTGRPIKIVGHLDQVRRGSDGCLEVWDLKHSRFDGQDLLRKYFWQQAAYTLAAAESYGEPVRWGGIIATKGYLVRGAKSRDPDGFRVHFRSSMTVSDCRAALDVIRFRVSLVRRGLVSPTPGVFCSYCPAKSFRQCRRELPGIF